MSERTKNYLLLALMFIIFVIMNADILFTSKIVRAPDIINEFYWGVREFRTLSFAKLATVNLTEGLWNMLVNSGFTTEGGEQSYKLLLHHRLIFKFIPLPTSVAWFMVLHLFFGGVGTYLYCRVIGVGRWGALLGGLVFGLTAEHISLINAGHAQKIATISFAPLAFYLYEAGMQKKRTIWFLASAVVLAFQFFNYHWQIAFYTCLSIGVYGLLRLAGEAWADRGEIDRGKRFVRLFGMNLALLVFFLTTVSMSLMPLANWSRETNRGVHSGENQGKGGLNREEAMSWSMPPEELITFIIPGYFGFSRQEGGENPTNIPAYYWGRMHFTQTNDYLGLLPWLLLPLPLLFRRDRYTLLALAGVGLSLFFAMGKYTLFYNLLYDNFPGINRFRVPKMILFVTAMSVGVLAARGMDILADPAVRASRLFRRYLAGLGALPIVLLLFLLVMKFAETAWIERLMPTIAEPTRYESGAQLVVNRWNNILLETGIASLLAGLYAVIMIVWCRSNKKVGLLYGALLLVFLIDAGRVNSKFLFTVEMPQKSRGVVTPVIEFLQKESKEYRVMPMNGDPQQYSSAGIPTFFFSMAVQQVRWQDILDTLSFASAVPDMLNLKYLIFDSAQYAAEVGQLGSKYSPVYYSPDGKEVVVRNNAVLPKVWLTPSAVVIADRQQRLATLLNPGFNPREVALVETPPELPLAQPGMTGVPGFAKVDSYTAGKITVQAETGQNAVLVIGDKFYKGWRAFVDGKEVVIHPVNHVLRGIYLPSGKHIIEYRFDPAPYRVGKWLSLVSMGFFVILLVREWRLRKITGSKPDNTAVSGDLA